MSWSKPKPPIPVGIDVDAWIEKNVMLSDFHESTTALLAFRICSPTDHWINRLAALLTSQPGEKPPGGRMCHVELLLPISEGSFVKCSVTKKVYDKKTGEFRPGCVHCVIMHPNEFSTKYTILSLQDLDRSEIVRGIRFCMLNNGMPFNLAGFYANLTLPGGIGVRRWDESLMTKRRTYFCSEFIVTALQAMISGENKSRFYPALHWRTLIRSRNPAKSNPNSLYRLMKRAANAGSGVVDRIPEGSKLNV